MDSLIPPVGGSYALRLRLIAPVRLMIGRLGEFDIPAGDYIYLGSARGPGGLRARLQHHAKIAANPRWHLDWLRPYTSLSGGWYATAAVRLECAWSQSLLRLPGALAVVSGFGASDCTLGCLAHLIWLPAKASPQLLSALLQPLSADESLVPFANPAPGLCSGA